MKGIGKAQHCPETEGAVMAIIEAVLLLRCRILVLDTSIHSHLQIYKATGSSSKSG